MIFTKHYMLKILIIYILIGSTQYLLSNEKIDKSNTNISSVYFEFGAVDHTNGSSWYASWNQKMQEHSSESAYIDGTTYTHLFLDGNNVVIQYWFFYPFNHSANRHEGDWEHINVWIENQNPDIAQLVKVEYYFHHKYLDRNPNSIELQNGTHPVVYVGGQNSTAPGVHSGANFPEAKFWEAVGAVNFDERVLGNGPTISYSSFIDSEPDDEYGIVILPDIKDIDFSENPEMSWFGTKIPWGIPTTPTYMGWVEAVPFVPDMDIPPQGPAYRAGWNKVSGDGYDLYVYEE